MIRFHILVKNSDIKERSLFMVGLGTEENVLCALKNICPTIYLSKIFSTSLKENCKARVHLCLNMIYIFTLLLC